MQLNHNKVRAQRFGYTLRGWALREPKLSTDTSVVLAKMTPIPLFLLQIFISRRSVFPWTTESAGGFTAQIAQSITRNIGRTPSERNEEPLENYRKAILVLLILSSAGLLVTAKSWFPPLHHSFFLSRASQSLWRVLDFKPCIVLTDERVLFILLSLQIL